MRLTGPLPVSVPQSGWASVLQLEACDYMHMIEKEHKQCLEEAQLENETAGEAPLEEREVPQAPKKPHSSSHEPRSTSHVFYICCRVIATRSCWIVEQKILGETGEPDGRREALTDLPSRLGLRWGELAPEHHTLGWGHCIVSISGEWRTSGDSM